MVHGWSSEEETIRQWLASGFKVARLRLHFYYMTIHRLRLHPACRTFLSCVNQTLALQYLGFFRGSILSVSGWLGIKQNFTVPLIIPQRLHKRACVLSLTLFLLPVSRLWVHLFRLRRLRCVGSLRCLS